MNIRRFGVSLEDDLLEKLDKLVSSKRFPNRSQAIRFLINDFEADQKWEKNMEVAGAIVLVYDHHKKNLQEKSMTIQHDFHDLILSVQHVHLNHTNCLETIAVKGKSKKLLQLADRLKGIKGMKHLRFVMTVAG